jgi:cobalt-zinc-cadmium efflux system outer membrane protein
VQYNAMLMGTYDLLQAKDRELDAQRGAVEATRDYWIARAELERAVGGSFERHLSEPDPQPTPLAKRR